MRVRVEVPPDGAPSHRRWLLLLVVVNVLFFSKILFTQRFSVLLDYEAANQGYCWLHFSAASVKQGLLPLWDPYKFSGHSFVGETQTGVFYPLKVFLCLWPFDSSGLFSERLYHLYYVFVHVLGGWFMYLLAAELGLCGFAGFVAALCFSLGGFVGAIGWPDMLDSSVWLPLIVLFLIRAFRYQSSGVGLLYSVLAGVALGMTILGGRVHIPMMNVLVILGAAAFLTYNGTRTQGLESRRRSRWLWAGVVVITLGLVGFSVGAVQLLPSMEYAKLAVRYIGDVPAVPAAQRMAYADASRGFGPRSLFAFPFGNLDAGAGEFSTYFGVMPTLLALLGAWCHWGNAWVKFLVGLSVAAYFYTLGSYSFLHGLLYVLVPYLWVAREAGRFIYIAHFGMALLAGFGVQALFSDNPHCREALAKLTGFLKWIFALALFVLLAPKVSGMPRVDGFMQASLLFVIGSYGLLALALRGRWTRIARFFLVGLVLWELNIFHWSIQDKEALSREGRNHFQVLLDCRKLAEFFKSQPGLFRVDVATDSSPNIGDLYGVQTTWGMGATVLRDYERFRHIGPRANDLLNVRYIVRDKEEGDQRPVFTDGRWKVYENPTACPRAWVVYNVATEPSFEKVLSLIMEPHFDPLRLAFVSEPVPGLEGGKDQAPAEVGFLRYGADGFELRVRSSKRGLLVLSEIYYPGWKATVNSEVAHVYKVNGIFRGVAVPAGKSQVKFRYAPRSVLMGAALTIGTFLGVLIFGAVVCLRDRRPAAR